MSGGRGTTESELAVAFGFQPGNRARKSFQLQNFVAQSEHIDAWLEYRENVPDFTGRGRRFDADIMRKWALEALQDREAKHRIPRKKGSKGGPGNGQHEMRYVVRIVEWCRQRGGCWSQEPLSEELCGRAYDLLKHLKYHARKRLMENSTLMKAMEDAFRGRGKILTERQRERAFGPTAIRDDPAGLDPSTTSNFDTSPNPQTHPSPFSGSMMHSQYPSQYPQTSHSLQLAIRPEAHNLSFSNGGFPRHDDSTLPNDQVSLLVGEVDLDHSTPTNHLGTQQVSGIHGNYHMLPLGIEHYNRTAQLPNIQHTADTAQHTSGWFNLTPADVELGYDFGSSIRRDPIARSDQAQRGGVSSARNQRTEESDDETLFQKIGKYEWD